MKRWDHPDQMLEELSAGQFEDWQRFHRQFCIGHNRDDVHWAIQIADYRNAHKAETEPDIRPIDVMPYYDEFAEDSAMSDEELMLKMRGST